MKAPSFLAAANIGFIILLVAGSAAECAELKVLAANGIQAVVEDLGPKYERATGHKLAIKGSNLLSSTIQGDTSAKRGTVGVRS